VTVAIPAEAIRVAGTDAVSCVAPTKVVESAVPFQSTVAPETKLVPFTASVNTVPPGAADAGLRLEMAGSNTTVTVTLDVVVSCGTSISVAETVMVC
jgi:hypothetical protein